MPKTQIFFDYAYQGIEFRIVLFIFSFLSYTLGNYFIFLISTKIHYFNKSLNKIQYFLFCHFSVKNKFNKTKDLKNCILINRNIGTIRRNKQIYKNFWDDKQLQNKLLNDKFFGKIERHCVISDYVNFFKKNKLVKAQIIHNFTTTQDKYTNEEHKLFDFVDNKNLKNTIYINDNSSIVNDVTNNELGLNIFNFNKTEKCELINEKINQLNLCAKFVVVKRHHLINFNTNKPQNTKKSSKNQNLLLSNNLQKCLLKNHQNLELK